MPIYEYRCTGCGKEIEVLETSSGNAGHQCASCGKEMERIFSTYGVGRSSEPAVPSCPNPGCQGGTCQFS